MNFDGFSMYMPLENDKIASLKDVTKAEDVGFGIVKRRLEVNTKEQEETFGRRIGVYATYDFKDNVYTSMRAAKTMENLLVSAVRSFVGASVSCVLVVGLGNGNIAADSLGTKVFAKIDVSGQNNGKCSHKPRVMGISTSVFGQTGIQSAELVLAVVKHIKPSCVVLVDSLATASCGRVCRCFQLSTAGITPGGGVGNDNSRIDKDLLGVPVLAIGVPTLVTLPNVVYGAVKEYVENKGCKIDEYLVRVVMADEKLSGMVVAPKNVDAEVENASVLISNALNLAFAL